MTSIAGAAIGSIFLFGATDIINARTWTDDSGTYRIEAELSEILENSVKLRTMDGRLIEVPLERLSIEDRRHIHSERLNGERAITTPEVVSPPQTLNQPPEDKGTPTTKTPASRDPAIATETPSSPISVKEESPGTLGEFVGAAVCFLIPVGFLALVLSLAVRQSRNRRKRRQAAFEKLNFTMERARRFVAEKFLVQPCSRCHEFSMQLLQVSPNARSVRYKCHHCGKTNHAPAISPDSADIVGLLEALGQAGRAYAAEFKLPLEEHPIDFLTAPAPLPFEQTQRSPIPETVRHEVWRRDQGKCVTCGSNANLQYDHIIPVARGGATSVTNLQLLCERCNQAKGAKI